MSNFDVCKSRSEERSSFGLVASSSGTSPPFRFKLPSVFGPSRSIEPDRFPYGTSISASGPHDRQLARIFFVEGKRPLTEGPLIFPLGMSVSSISFGFEILASRPSIEPPVVNSMPGTSPSASRFFPLSIDGNVPEKSL